MGHKRYLGEIAEIRQGRYLAPEEMADCPTDANPIPVWGARGIIGFTNYPTYSEAVPLVTCRGSGCGLIQWTGGSAYISNNAMAVVPTNNKPSDTRYLYYSLLTLDFSDVTTGSAQPQITIGHLSKKKVFWLESENERAAIAQILGTLDDKIELNRRMSETLEQMARAIFKAWFVDFEPVRAKMSGRWKKGQSLPGLPAHLWDLFPDRLVNSELGEIPSGWDILEVGHAVDIVKGVSYRSADLAESDIALVTLKSFNRGGGYRSDGLKPYIGPFKQEQIINPGELILAQTDVTQAAEVIGRPALVVPDNRFRKLVASLDVLIIRPSVSELSSEFFYLLFKTEEFKEYIYGHVNGTTVLHLDKTGVSGYRFAKPPKTLATLFSNFVTQLFSQIMCLDVESRILAALRDALLPKLISGEIRVKDVERFIKEAENA